MPFQAAESRQPGVAGQSRDGKNNHLMVAAIRGNIVLQIEAGDFYPFCRIIRFFGQGDLDGNRGILQPLDVQPKLQLVSFRHRFIAKVQKFIADDRIRLVDANDGIQAIGVSGFAIDEGIVGAIAGNAGIVPAKGVQPVGFHALRGHFDRRNHHPAPGDFHLDGFDHGLAVVVIGGGAVVEDVPVSVGIDDAAMVIAAAPADAVVDDPAAIGPGAFRTVAGEIGQRGDALVGGADEHIVAIGDFPDG